MWTACGINILNPHMSNIHKRIRFVKLMVHWYQWYDWYQWKSTLFQWFYWWICISLRGLKLFPQLALVERRMFLVYWSVNPFWPRLVSLYTYWLHRMQRFMVTKTFTKFTWLHGYGRGWKLTKWITTIQCFFSPNYSLFISNFSVIFIIHFFSFLISFPFQIFYNAVLNIVYQKFTFTYTFNLIFSKYHSIFSINVVKIMLSFSISAITRTWRTKQQQLNNLKY